MKGVNYAVKSCGRKLRHPDREAAKRHAARLNRRGKRGERWKPYQCEICHAWHVGRPAGAK